jgi:hypothetical protein
MENKSPAEKLADLIEGNPNCTFDIDNDAWYITTPESPESQIADDSDYAWRTKWYDHSSNYGSGLAEALVILLNRRGFNIKAQSV